MDHLVQDLSLALEDSEPRGPVNFRIKRKWGIKRRTKSAENLHLSISKLADNHSDDSSSSNNELRMRNLSRGKHSSLHQSDSDDMSFSLAAAKNITKSNSLRMKSNIPTFVPLKGKYGLINKLNCSLESDSFNENSPAGSNVRRKRKLKRICIDDDTSIPSGKKKRRQSTSTNYFKPMTNSTKIRPLNQSLIDKLEKFCVNNMDDDTTMETQYVDGNVEEHEQCEIASESSVSLSGGEGHEGDDELTDWAPQPDLPIRDCINDDPFEKRAGCQRVHNKRPGFSRTTGANELGKLAALCSVDLWFEDANSLLRKTRRTTSGLSTSQKKLRTHEMKFV